MRTPTRSRLLVGQLVVVAGLVGFAAVTYLALVVVLGRMIGLPADRPSTVLAVTATSVVALGLPRVRRWLRRLAVGAHGDDRLARITRELSGSIPAEGVLPRIARAVAEATSAGTVEIRVRHPGTAVLVGRWPPTALPIEEKERGLAVRPILLQSAWIGELALRPKVTRSGRLRQFPQAEKRLLDALVARAGLTLENVLLRDALHREIVAAVARADELRASRRRVVEAADAERHRLERNIHDGAQQHLVALSVNLGLARGQCGSNPRGASATLKALGPAVAHAMAELDDLGRGIYPRALTAGGVAEALVGLATAAGPAVIVTAPEQGVRWPADVEAAVYFTCAEALQNATKHALAERIDVRVDATAEAVSFEVHDDGIGFDPAPDREGGGLQGMRDRVEALGGVLLLSSATGHGTTVSGQVPLPGSRG